MDHITCEPGILSYKKGDLIKLKPEGGFNPETTALPAMQPGA